MLERTYQAHIIKKLRRLLLGCVLLKNDSSYFQGVPDLIVLYGPYWCMLEIKADAQAKFQANQEYWLEHLNEMSFAAVIHPDNEAEILRAISQAFGLERNTRLSKR